MSVSDFYLKQVAFLIVSFHGIYSDSWDEHSSHRPYLGTVRALQDDVQFSLYRQKAQSLFGERYNGW